MTKSGTIRPSVPPACEDQALLIESVRRDIACVPTPKPGSYEVSYPEFLKYFRNVASIDRHHLIIAANFAYGWMPTILDFRSEQFDNAVGYLTRARERSDLTVDELAGLAKLINNSMVGASKLLHFVSPARYAIWDSRVARYLGTRPFDGRRGAEQYASYNECCRAISLTADGTMIARSVSSIIGDELEPMRALELVMFHGGLKGHTYEPR